MYFVSYIYDENEMIGLLNKDKNMVIPIQISGLDTLIDLIENCNDELINDLKNLVISDESKGIPIENIKLCAPISYPKRNIICLGKNYLDHAKEIVTLPTGKSVIPEYPIYFSKTANPAIGHNDKIKIHTEVTEMIDYEVELAIVIGKSGSNIPMDKVEDYIFGYTIVNDITARDVQTKHAQWFKGKSLDTFCPMGPYLVHKSQLHFPLELDIMCKVNGEIRQHSNTKNLMFDIPYIISDLSKGFTLNPGDIILTGTPAGVGFGFKPPKFLKSGDVVECYIEGIGSLINIVD